jgi:hypothetical protein
LPLFTGRRGGYDVAEALQKRALASREKHLGAEHPDTLISMNNLTNVYLLQGRYDDAEALLKGVLAGHEKHLGADYPHT